MRYDRAFRDPQVARRLIDEIRAVSNETVQIMEFCGGHTHAIMRYGIREALGTSVRMMSGPGCPVCVTADADIDQAIALAYLPGVTVATFGDMIRVPGSHTSLQEARARGANVEIVYSALDALQLARKDPHRSVVMLGIGFETTAPTVAASLVQARKEQLANYYVYSMHKLTPPAMRGILDAGEVRVEAVLGPGHVSAITGWHAWDFLPHEYAIPCAVSGFEPVDILQSVLVLAKAHQTGQAMVENTYARGASPDGNQVAQSLMSSVFSTSDAAWRGLGEIPDSGLDLGHEYAAHNARLHFDLPEVTPQTSPHQQSCRCGEVLRAVMEPPECPLFGQACTPARPIGPCMVSAEGACAAHFEYGGALD